MITLEYIIFIFISVILSFISIWFKQSYIDGKYKKLIETVRNNKIQEIFICMTYILFSIFAVSYQGAKELSLLEVVQYLFLWDGIFLISMIDLKIKKIPDNILIILLAIRFVGLIVSSVIYPEYALSLIFSSIIGMVIGAIIILTVLLISKGSVGAGDLKLFSIIGFYFGIQGLLQIMIYTLFPAAIFAILLLIIKKAEMKTTMPMAPFIFLGLSIYYIFL